MEGFITFLLCFALFIWVMKRIFPLLLTRFIKRQVKKGGQTEDLQVLEGREVLDSGQPVLEENKMHSSIMSRKKRKEK